MSASNAQVAPDVSKSAIELGAGAGNGIRMERQGNQRWLVINQPTDGVWNTLRKFWVDTGFVLSTDNKPLGIMETEWAENRAKIPMDGLRKLFGGMIDSIYSTSERDKFRTRIEINQQGETEIFVSHRGVIEVYTEERRPGPQQRCLPGARCAGTGPQGRAGLFQEAVHQQERSTTAEIPGGGAKRTKRHCCFRAGCGWCARPNRQRHRHPQSFAARDPLNPGFRTCGHFLADEKKPPGRVVCWYLKA